MFTRVRSKLTYANVVATLALFIAVGAGGAYAANTIGSSDIVDESIQSVDIKNGEVKTSEYADNSVGPKAIGSNAVQNSELASNVVGTGKIHDGGVGTADLADNAVTSAKVAANALTGGDITESSLNLGGFFAATATTGTCNADGGAPTACASMSLTLPRPGRLLVDATGSWQTFSFEGGSTTNDTLLVRGRCQLAVDTTAFGQSQTMGERQQSGVASNHPPDAPGTMALTGMSGVLTAGFHTIELDCTEEDADIDWRNINLTAALVDDDGTPPGLARAAPAPAGHPDVTRAGKRSTSSRR